MLVDGDFVLTESAAIVLYLAEKYGKFLPTDARGRAEVNKWLLFTVTELEQPLWRIAKNEFLYPEEQRLAADIPLAGEDFRRMADVSAPRNGSIPRCTCFLRYALRNTTHRR